MTLAPRSAAPVPPASPIADDGRGGLPGAPGARRARGTAPRLALALCLLVAGACDDELAPAPGSGGRRAPDAGADGGRTSRPPPPVRPPDGPRRPEADVELSLPFQGAPLLHLIELEADLSTLDVQLSIDTTQSIRGEIDALQADLEGRLVPGLTSRVPRVSFGVSHFEDFPRPPWGFPGEQEDQERPDTPFELLTPITSDLSVVSSAVARLDTPLGFGQDQPESGAEALWQIATGAGYPIDARDDPLIAPFDGVAREGGGTIGGVGFREGALHVVVHVTDAPSHRPGDYGDNFPDTHTLEQAAEALEAIDAHVVGIVSTNCRDDDDECDNFVGRAARDDLEQLALATRAVAAPIDGACPHGVGGAPIPPQLGECPLVFDVAGDGSGLADTVVDAIVTLVDGIRFAQVHGLVGDDPLGFVSEVRPVVVEQPDGEPAPTLADLLPADDPDGVDDSFVEVRGRARLAFEVVLQNTVIAPTDRDQRFRVVVQIMGDGLIVLEQTLRLTVPAAGASAADAAPPDADEDAGGPRLASP